MQQLRLIFLYIYRNIKNIKVIFKNNIHIIVKGIRNADNLESELNQYYYNKSLNNELETICLLSSHENILISSSAIKELAHFHQSYDSYLPSEIVDDVKKKLG